MNLYAAILLYCPALNMQIVFYMHTFIWSLHDFSPVDHQSLSLWRFNFGIISFPASVKISETSCKPSHIHCAFISEKMQFSKLRIIDNTID